MAITRLTKRFKSGWDPGVPSPPPSVRRVERRPWLGASVWCPSESAAVAPRPRFGLGPLGPLLSGHVLRDGETVILIQKPSLWFILTVSWRVVVLAIAAVLAARFWLPQPSSYRTIEVMLLVLAMRLMVATLQWMGRLYILTDHRVIRLAGVLQPGIFDCSLRRVAEVRHVSRWSERLFRLGSIDVVAAEPPNAIGDWRAVRHPRRVLAKIRRMVDQAGQGGSCLRR